MQASSKFCWLCLDNLIWPHLTPCLNKPQLFLTCVTLKSLIWSSCFCLCSSTVFLQRVVIFPPKINRNFHFPLKPSGGFSSESWKPNSYNGFKALCDRSYLVESTSFYLQVELSTSPLDTRNILFTSLIICITQHSFLLAREVASTSLSQTSPSRQMAPSFAQLRQPETWGIVDASPFLSYTFISKLSPSPIRCTKYTSNCSTFPLHLILTLEQQSSPSLLHSFLVSCVHSWSV